MKRSHDQDDCSSQPVSRQKRQLDDKYRDIVAQRQVLNNQRQRVLSLQDLTLNFVVQIVKQCAHNKEDPRPLDEYPSPLLDLVFGKLTEPVMYDGDMTMHFDIVKQTITQRSRQVKLTLLNAGDSHYKPPWSAWSHEKVQSVLALLDKCKNQLTKLEVSYDWGLKTEAARPSLPQIHELVRHQANLTELRLTRCDISDQTLALISATCLNLGHLDIEGNKAVTDAGLQYLIRGPEGKLSSITHLGVRGTSVTGQGIAKFMFELRDQLESVEAYDFEMSTALVELCQISPPVQLPKYKYLHNNTRDITPYFAKIVSMMPNVISLELSSCPDVAPLLSLTKVKELNLQFNVDGQNLNFISENLLPQWSSNLTYVELTKYSARKVEIDFSVFTQCLNLEYLELSGFNLKIETNHELLPSSFSKLCTFCIYGLDRNLPDEIVAKMLTSPCLEKFDVDFVIPEHVITSVISEVHANPQILSKLRELDFCCTSEFTLDTWIQLMCVLPDNTEITISDHTISHELLGKLKSFALRNNINVRISDW